jgi:hypothetical protein
MNDGESEDRVKQLKQDADFDPGVAAPGVATPAREADVKVPPKPNA